MNINAVTK